MTLARLALVTYLAAMTGNALAATDGELGGTSEGTAVINIAKENAVKITNLDDIDLGTSGNLTTTATGSDDVCVYSSTGAYGLVMTSANSEFVVGNSLNVDCDGQTNATFTISVAPSDFNAADPGTYTDTLIMLVQPD